MKKARPKKPAKLRFYLLDSDQTFSYWTEEQLKSIKFQDLCQLAFDNKIELMSIIFADAISGKDFTIGKINVSKELDLSLNNLFKLFPTVKYYVDQQQKLMNLNYIKA